jgi:Spherulation-specific family 4/Glycosyl hydrolase family 26
MSRRLTRRNFLRETITTALGVGALGLGGRASIIRATAVRPAGPADLLPPDINSACAPPATEPLRWRIGAPQPGTFYHGVYPGHCVDPDRCAEPEDGTGEEDNITLNDLLSYSSDEHGVGRDVPVAWVYFSNNWGRDERFPEATARWIRDRRSVPFIRLMLRKDLENQECGASKVSENKYPLERINAGCFDDKLRAWGKAAADFGSPLIVEWGTEVNGCWFHWNGKWHGREAGAALFRNAFRRIVRIVRDEAGARNITWAFHANGSGDPDPSEPGNEWNRICRYYPGDEFVDWVGLSVYGAQNPLSKSCVSFERLMDAAMDGLGDLKMRKPLFIFEFGATGGHSGCGAPGDNCDPAQCDAGQWADAALRLLLSNRWPEVRGFSWWNELWEDKEDGKKYVTNMRVQTVPNLKEKFQHRLRGKPTISCPAYERVEARPSQLRLLVPAYFDPGGAGAQQWDAMITAAGDVEIVAIANPGSGPGSKADPDYRRYIGKAAAYGMTVVGYVSTDYGKVPLKQVQEDIRRWLDWYPQVGGFFFDEQSPDDINKAGEDMIAHYREIFGYAKERLAKMGCGQLVVSNPGTACSEHYLTEAKADILCLYESPEKHEPGGDRPFRYYAPPAWMKSHKPHRFAALVMQVESVDMMREYLRKAAADGFGYVYVTDHPPRDPSGQYCQEQCQQGKPAQPACETDCNPWNRLPTYWSGEVESLQLSAVPLTCSFTH